MKHWFGSVALFGALCFSMGYYVAPGPRIDRQILEHNEEAKASADVEAAKIYAIFLDNQYETEQAIDAYFSKHPDKR